MIPPTYKPKKKFMQLAIAEAKRARDRGDYANLASQRLPHASATNQVKGPQPIENRQEGSIGPAI